MSVYEHLAGQDGVPVCLFCLTPLESRRAQSKEHLLAKSWSTLLDPATSMYTPDQWHQTRDGEWVQRPEDRHLKPPFATTVPVVCHKCNNGWMSQLEDRVKPILWPLAQGKAAVITRAEGAVIAQWMAKTALVLESSTPPGEAKAQNGTHNFNVMNAAYADTYPVQFATWAFPVVPNDSTQMRSKVGTVFFGDHACTGHHVRASLVQIREIAICSVHAADRRIWEQRVRPFLAVAAPALFPEYGDFHLHRDEAYSVARADALALDLLRGIVGEPTFHPPAATSESTAPE